MKTVLTGSKRILAVIMAMLIVGSAFAITSFAADDMKLSAKDVSTANSVLILVVENIPDGYTVESTGIAIKKGTDDLTKDTDFSVLKQSDGFKITFSSLAVNDKLTFTVTAKKESATDVTATETITIKNTKDAPKTLEVIEKTKDSLTLTKIEGALYAAVKTDDAKEPADSDWKTTNSLTGLTPGTFYDVYAKYAETSTTYESDAKKIQAKTLAASEGKKAEKPVLENVTTNTIKVAYHEGYEYSIDGGKTFDTANEWKNLKAATTYYIAQRIKVDENISEVNPSSDAITVTTNSATANITNFSQVKNPTTDAGSEVATGTKVTVTAYAVKRTSGEKQWGDIQFVPKTLQVKDGDSYKDVATFTEKTNGSYQASYTPTGEGTCNLRVVYAKQRWNSTKFEELDTDNHKDLSFKTKAQWQIYLNKFIAFLTTTLPQYIMKAIAYLRGN